MRFSLFLSLCLFLPLYSEEPFGKDADLVPKRQVCKPAPSKRPHPLSALGQGLIRFHQEVISPADGPRSHFYPSSSEYTRQAMQKYGFFQGVLLGCDRLMRENDDPWVYKKVRLDHGLTLKYDPVP